MKGLPRWGIGKESACNARDVGSVPGWGRSPGVGNGNPLQDSCLENSMGRGAGWAVVCGVAKSGMWLRTHPSSWTAGHYHRELGLLKKIPNLESIFRELTPFVSPSCFWIFGEMARPASDLTLQEAQGTDWLPPPPTPSHSLPFRFRASGQKRKGDKVAFSGQWLFTKAGIV